MSTPVQRYCLDANVLIQGWQKYYSPKLCASYWDVLNHLGKSNRVFIPKAVFEEIQRTEDDLTEWLSTCSIPVAGITGGVAKCLTDIYGKHETHKFLVDNKKGRSLADPWVIAHAIHENATVITKEEKITASATKIKIPNVCENMGVRWINDFQFVEEMNIRFSCEVVESLS